MIEIKLRFWTNDIANKSGKIIPKHAWSSGVVRIEKNAAHGIVSCSPKPFNSLLDGCSVIEQMFIENEIVLHLDKRMKKYIAVAI
jgi:hypothetical protein